MAQMFPDTVDFNAEYGEKLVFDVFEKSLPKDWIVIHSLRMLNRLQSHYINFEADFIILVPRHGIVCIEVKNWRSARITDGIWEHQTQDGTWKSMDGRKKSPLHQASLACKSLKNALLDSRTIRRDRKLEFCSMAILIQNKPRNFDTAPTAEDTELSETCHIPLDSLYICGYNDLVDNLQERITSIFSQQDTRGRNMSAKVMEDIRKYLVPNVRFYEDINAYAQMLDDAVKEIDNVLPLLEPSTGGVRVEGCAGSGKTTIACKEFARLAAAHPDKRFLFLCYNLKLCNMLKNTPELKDLQDKDHVVSGFHAFGISHGLVPAGRTDLIQQDAHLIFFREDAYDTIREELDRQPKFDYFFVDEAQDFGAKRWELLRHCLTEDAKMYIFADRHQKLGDTPCELPDIPTRIHLKRNLRNTREIAEFANKLLPPEERGKPLNLSAAPVRIARGSDDREERAEQVRRFIKEIQETYMVGSRHITVLSPRRIFREKCCLSLLPELENIAEDGETESAMWERYTRCTAQDATRSLGDTTRKFKGMESSFVILADIPEPDTEESEYRFTKNDLYVAVTRAKFGLYIVPTVKGAQYLNAIIKP